MIRTVERFVRFAAGRLLIINAIALVAIKLVLPYGGAGLADISSTLQPLDTGVVVQATNQARSSAALPALARSKALDAAAQAKLDDMTRRGYFAHVSPIGQQAWDFIVHAGYSYKNAGENLARGFTDPNAAVTAWLNSPTHRQNIVNPAYRDIGIAAGRVTINGKSSVVIVQLFGTPQPTAVKKSAAAPRKTSIGSPRPVAVAVPDSVLAQVSRGMSGALGVYLTAILGLLLVAGMFVGTRRSLVQAVLAHAALLALLVLVPVAAGAGYLIF